MSNQNGDALALLASDDSASSNGSLVKATSAADVFKLGQVLFESGYFSDIKSGAQAIVKILRGQELGIGPIASLENIAVIEGKTSLGAGLIGALIKKSGRYDYQVLETTAERAEIAYFERGEEIGRSSFSMDEARQAGLERKQNWQRYPKAMLFARAMTQGARWYCPDVFSGAVYTPEELETLPPPKRPIDTPVQTVDTATGEIAEPQPKRPRSRAEMVQRYRELTIAVGQWNADESHEPIEHRLYSDAWTDDELKENGLQLATALDQAEKTGTPGTPGEDARASVI